MARLCVGVVLMLSIVGCQVSFLRKKNPSEEAMPDLTPVWLEYVDTDGFDALLETALVNESPVIIIQTQRTRPDWEGRLNAWIAAWNRSGKARARTYRGQLPFAKFPLDADSIGELRKLVDSLLDRIEVAAERNAAWWANERERNLRISLMKPYNLRFHRDGDGPIRLILFHGSYAAYYPQFMRSLMQEPNLAEECWTRTVECSRLSQASHPEGVSQLVPLPKKEN